MKKAAISFVLILTLVFSFASCGDPKTTTPGETTPPVTTPPQTAAPIDPTPYLDAYIGFPYLSEQISEYGSISKSAYASLSVSMDITEKDVEDYIASLLAENPILLEVVDRAVRDGDFVYIYFEGSVDGDLFGGGSNMDDEEPYPLEIGSGSFIPGFEEALIGLVPADTLAQDAYIDVTFPSDYHDAELAGKAAKFRIQVVYIVDYEERTELTPEFLSEIGYTTEESDVISAFRADLLSDMRKEIVDHYDETLRQRLLDVIFPAFEAVKLPEDELTRLRAIYIGEIEYYYDYYNYIYMIYYGETAFASVDECAVWYLGLEKGADWSAELDRLVAKEVSYMLMLYAIADNEGIGVTPEQFAKMLGDMVASYGMTADEIIERTGADVVYNEVIRLSVTDLLMLNATVDNGELPLEND